MKFNANIPKVVCNHLVGENHTVTHRMGAGTIIIFIGVMIAQGGKFVPGFLHIILDGSGYLIHAFGTIPFIEKIIEIAHEGDKPNSETTKTQENDG